MRTGDMRITHYEPCPGGWWVTVEIPDAYRDGNGRLLPRHEQRFIPADRLGGSPQERLDAISELFEGDPFADIADVDLREWRRLRASGDPNAIEHARVTRNPRPAMGDREVRK